MKTYLLFIRTDNPMHQLAIGFIPARYASEAKADRDCLSLRQRGFSAWVEIA